jgi:DNA-binding response OmpR family regulator
MVEIVGFRHCAYHGDVVPSERSNGRKVVLIVEDDDDLRAIFRNALRFGDFDVYEAVDGVDALRTIENVQPDLVVLDVGLPTLDGLSVWQELTAQPHTRHIPVIVVTGVEGFALPGGTVLRKPVSPYELVGAVRRFLQVET